jgi:divalent metal cation (Fe/Co/Zn/Cd) transporter
MDNSLQATNKLWTAALWLAGFTIFYNLIEGIVSVGYGGQEESLTLFGFGVDSFIELLSGAGILAMVLRIRRNPDQHRSTFEQTALRITGSSFYILTIGLTVGALYSIFTNHKPESTLPGAIISGISILVMWALVMGKRQVGKALSSQAILADANCTMVCIYMSLVLLASSVVYQLTGFGLIDSIGAIGLAYFSFNEGREAFEKAESLEDTCGCACAADD